MKYFNFLNMDYFEFIPNDVKIYIFLNVPVRNIVDVCSTSTKFNHIIDTNVFWQQKSVVDFGESTISCKEDYKNYGTVYLFEIDIKTGLLDTQSTIIPKIRAKFVSCGGTYNMIIDLNDNIWVFEVNYDNTEFDFTHKNHLGLGDVESVYTPTQIPNIKAKLVSCHYTNTLVLHSNNNVMSCGINHNGRLGLEQRLSIYEYTVLTQIPYIKAKNIVSGYHSFIIDLDDNIWGFGENYYGQLGLGDQNNRNAPVQIPNIKAKSVACESQHSILIDLDDNVWSFGSNEYGQLGLGDENNRNTPTQIPNIKALAVACGTLNTLILDINHNVWSFGNAEDGSLGLSDFQNKNTPTQLHMQAKAICCFAERSMIIDMDDNVWYFGCNYDEDIDYVEDRNIPRQINNVKAKQISCGHYHTLIISK
jgi:hypothetical protein